MASSGVERHESAASRDDSELADSRTEHVGDSTTASSPNTAYSVPPRTHTVLSAASSIVDDSWTKQYVLSFDGGGIRGYSSLLIVKELVTHIARIEQEPPEVALSSYHPQSPIERQPDYAQEERREEIGGSSFKKWLDKIRGRHLIAAMERNGQYTLDESGGDPGLSEIATEIRARHNRNQYLPCHYFDYVGGTSTGGLISIMLSRLRMSIDDAIEEYEHLAGYIFGHPRIFSVRGPIFFPRDKYNPRRVVDVIEHVVSTRLCGKVPLLGQNPFASHERMCKTIVVSYGSRSNEDETANASDPPYLFRSYDHHPHVPKGRRRSRWLERNPGYAHRIPIWQVARATSAAPTYFNAITIEDQKFLDGGFGTNNPSCEIFWEVCQMNGNSRKSIGLLLSIGTGVSKLSKFAEGPLKRYYTYFKAAKKLAVNAEKVHEHMERELSPRENEEQTYYRFNVPIQASPRHTEDTSAPRPQGSSTSGRGRKAKPLGEMSLDEWKPESRLFRRPCNTTLRDIKDATEAYLATSEVQADLERVARILVQVRRERCDKKYWEIVSTGTQYRCLHENCHSWKSQKMRAMKNNLRSHLAHAHNITDESDVEAFMERGRCLC